MILYHGSERIIGQPVFGEGKPTNDYGRGFYCTEHKELAGEWACTEEHSGFVNIYEIDLSGLRVLDLTAETYQVLHWMALLVQNRTFDVSMPIAAQGREYLIRNYGVETEACDVIRGYRADDSYFSFAKAFLNNTISVEKLERAMRLGKLGEQIVLMSAEAFSALDCQGYERAESEIYFPKRKARDDKARRDFFEMRDDGALEGTYLIDLRLCQVFYENLTCSVGSSVEDRFCMSRCSIGGGNMNRTSYSKLYLEDAMETVAQMFDFVANGLGMSLEQFLDGFLATKIAPNFEHGNPKYVVGMSGQELTYEVFDEMGAPVAAVEYRPTADRSPEYWCGWALAYYQWKKGISFAEIFKRISVEELLALYPTLHEADLVKFESVLDARLDCANRPNALKAARKNVGISQAELAARSGVSLRSIQMYEQGKKEIRHAQVESVMNLARTLGCRIEDIL